MLLILKKHDIKLHQIIIWISQFDSDQSKVINITIYFSILFFGSSKTTWPILNIRLENSSKANVTLSHLNLAVAAKFPIESVSIWRSFHTTDIIGLRTHRIRYRSTKNGTKNLKKRESRNKKKIVTATLAIILAYVFPRQFDDVIDKEMHFILCALKSKLN